MPNKPVDIRNPLSASEFTVKSMDVNTESSPIQSETNTDVTKEKQNEEDRMSDFPDEILGRILYFLPSKEAAATAALSSRWRHVFWSTATRLEIDISKQFAKDNVEPAIQLFEAIFSCKTLIDARITTNYFHVSAAFCVPKLKHLKVESTEAFDSLEKTYDRLLDMEAGFSYVFGGKFIVFRKRVKPTDEDLLGVQTLGSLSIY